MASPGPTSSTSKCSALDLRTICSELGTLKSLWFAIGVQLGVPRYKLVEYRQSEDDPFSAVIDYWLKGNCEGVPVSWESIVKALRSKHVDTEQSTIVDRIQAKYCPHYSDVPDFASARVDPQHCTVVPDGSGQEMAAEKPHYDQSKQTTSKPENMPDEDTERDKIVELSRFCREVVIILQTVNSNEYQAVLTFMRPPSDRFSKAVIFPEPNMVVGKFANKKVALIRTMPGLEVRKFIEDAIKEYPNARYVLGVGVCYAFDSNKFKLADVLVSDTIIDNMIVKYNDQGEIEDRGQTVRVIHNLTKIFCMDEDTDCPASDAGRKSKMFSGTFCSNNILMNNKEMRDKYLRAHPRAIGGEMEGGELLKFVLDSKVEGVIIIKGVADYADGTNAKDWQFTAAMAAASYTESRLLNVAAHKLCPVSAQSEVPLAKRRVVEDSSAVEEPLPGYQDYESRLSRDARHFLGVVLDSMNKGVDSDRYRIAEPMLKWEEKLAPLMGLTESEIHDIKRGQYRDNHVLQRREVLKIWKDKKMLGATYGNLLKVFVEAGHPDCANKLFDLLKEK